MIVQIITRGNLIEFTATFHDVDGNVVTPASASLRVNYLASGARTTGDPLPMSNETNGAWVAEWDSSVASAARVYWSIKSLGPESATDGYFDLESNLANDAT